MEFLPPSFRFELALLMITTAIFREAASRARPEDIADSMAARRAAIDLETISSRDEELFVAVEVPVNLSF